MPRKSSVSLHQVATAMDQFERSSQAVTVRAVMAITGGTTSLVSELIDIVRRNRAEAARAKVALSPQLLIEINREVETHVARDTSSLQQELLECRQLTDELNDIIRDFESQQAQSEADLEALRLELAAKSKQAADEQIAAENLIRTRDVEMNAMSSDLATARQELVEAKNEVARLQHLNNTVGELKSAFEQSRASLMAAEIRAAVAEARLDGRQSAGKRSDTEKSSRPQPSVHG